MFGVLNLCKVKGSSGIISIFKKPRLFLYKKNVNKKQLIIKCFQNQTK